MYGQKKVSKVLGFYFVEDAWVKNVFFNHDNRNVEKTKRQTVTNVVIKITQKTKTTIYIYTSFVFMGRERKLLGWDGYFFFTLKP